MQNIPFKSNRIYIVLKNNGTSLRIDNFLRYETSHNVFQNIEMTLNIFPNHTVRKLESNRKLKK
jgi:hypothetical protein